MELDIGDPAPDAPPPCKLESFSVEIDVRSAGRTQRESG
jgi:hypothetical protein